MQSRTIFGSITLILMAFFIVMIMHTLYNKLAKLDLSDQKGWRNYKKPIITFIIMILSFLLIGLTIIVLIGIFL